MNPLIRFSELVRKGRHFRDTTLERTKRQLDPVGVKWYPYDCFANLSPLEQLSRNAALSLEKMAADRPILDMGTADGALAFFFESLGFDVHACDHAATNMNRLEGARTLAAALKSRVQIDDVDLDGGWKPQVHYGLTLFLGTLYHLKNPFGVLETLSIHTRYCFLSTRIASWSPDRKFHLGSAPVGYLLAPDECNGDATNYWIFSKPGLERLAERCGWRVLASLETGNRNSDPASAEGDERQFLLLESAQTPAI